MERIGRTQRIPLSSQRIDLGQRTVASAAGSNSASNSPVGRPFFCVTANQTGPLGVSRCSQSSSARPVDFRNPGDCLLRRIDARPLALDRDVGLLPRQTPHQQSQAPGRREKLPPHRMRDEPLPTGTGHDA